MSVVFYAESKKSKAYLTLSAAMAGHLLAALDYEAAALARDSRLSPEDVLLRIAAVRRQFEQGCGREFTAEGVDQRQMLEHLQELEVVAVRALDAGRSIVLL
jgi:hypothetical protein